MTASFRSFDKETFLFWSSNVASWFFAHLVRHVAIVAMIIIATAMMADDTVAVHALSDTTESTEVTLRVNGANVTTDVPPVIISDRTMVPARAVFESVGGEVLWHQYLTPPQVTVSYAGIRVNLTIDSAVAKVNDVDAVLDVPAQIVNDRTLIPVRFVSESINFKVEWDENNRVVDIYTPEYLSRPVGAEIKKIDVTADQNGTVVKISAAGIVESYTGHAESKRYILEVKGAAFVATTGSLEWQREISQVRGVSVSQYSLSASEGGIGLVAPYSLGEGQETLNRSSSASLGLEDGGVANTNGGNDAAVSVTRFVFDLCEDDIPVVTVSEGKDVIWLAFSKPVAPFNPWGDGVLRVILDPGHGIETPGKRSPDGSFVEYSFSREMADRIKWHLERHGVATVYTVYDETDMSLADRCKVANESGADVFVSLHANAAGTGKSWTSSHGWEIYVYKKGSYSEGLAKAIQNHSIPANGLTDRGIKAERFYVIRNVNMPAVLIEHAFYTNKDEVALLKSPEYREQLAIMDAKGILEFLGVPWSEP